MKRLLELIPRVFFAGGMLLFQMFNASLCSVSAAPSDDSAEFNLATLNSSAQIECTTPDGRVELLRPNEPSVASAALLQDQMLRCPLQEGVTTFVIKLPTTTLLDRFTFVNENAAAAGELKISVSNYQLPASSPKWVDVDGSVTFSRKRLFNLSMLGVEARYVKLAFNVNSAGQVTGLRLFGGKSSNDSLNYRFGWLEGTSESPTRMKKNEAEWDYASLKAKGRVIYVSSGQRLITTRMIDDNEESAYSFALNDRRPTAIVELAADEHIHRVTAIYRTRTQGRFDVYLLEDISKSSTDLNFRTPVASATDTDGDGVVEVDFNPEGARYVAIRFTPAESYAGGFEIVEINAFGDMPLAMLDVLEAPGVYTEISAATFPGEGHPDISTKLGVIAIPPIIPAVSQ